MIKNIISVLLLVATALHAQISMDDIRSGSSSSMMALQQISVTIGGEFIVNGTFVASTTERVDQFITRIYNTYNATMLTSIRDEASMLKFKEKYEQYALRNIELIHSDGSKELLDLAKFRLTGDFQNNPYLKEGDVIIFPVLDLETNFISIDGAVNKPTKFQFIEGDNLQTALFFARGVNKTYVNVDKVTISRLSEKGQKEEIITLSLDSNKKLRSGDRITVNYEERNNYDYRVLVLGEVNQPGYVPISKNSTTLKEVIEKAGGFTKDASIKFAELLRNYDSYTALRIESLMKAFDEQKLSMEELEKLNDFSKIEYLKMYRTADLVMGDTLFFGIDNQLRYLDGNSAINFMNLSDENSFESNYQVENEDVIIVPKKRNEVYVWGGVAAVGSYGYNENYTVWDYIEKAGGYTEIAYGSDEVYLIKGKSRNWINVEDHESIQIEPGDFIYVKKEVPRDTQFYITRVAAYASIIGSIATVVLLLNQIGK